LNCGNELTKLCETRAKKLFERRGQFVKKDETKRAVSKSWLAMKIKLLGVSAKLAQPLAMVNDARSVQRILDVEFADRAGVIHRGTG